MDIRPVSFESIEAEWKHLEKNSDTATFFQTYDFHRVFLNHFPQATSTILGVYDADTLVGIAPFVEKDSGQAGMTFEFCVTQKVSEGELVADYGDIIAQAGKEHDVWEAIISYTQKHNYHLHLDFIRESSPSFSVLKLLRRTVLQINEEFWSIDVAPFVRLPQTWDAYVSALPRKDRHELRRKMRKLERDGIVSLCDGRDLPADMSALFDLMRAGGADKQRFFSSQMEQYFNELITHFHNIGRVQLCFLSYQDKRIAAILSFVTSDSVLLYNAGFDPAFARYSPGIVLNGHMIRHAIQKGISVYDFLRGGERYKYNLGAVDQQLYRVVI